jgi:glyoxylase-like metal-dependent hydrolase (beta-lactamase superfamily II)
MLSALRLDRLTPNVYVIHGPAEDPTPANQALRNNPGIVLTRKGVVVIDPGSSVHVGMMVVHKVQSITSKPIVAVFNTHAHGDHWLGNEGIKLAYPRAVIYAHPTMKAMALQDEGRMWIKTFNERSGGAVEGTTLMGPGKEVSDGDVITIGRARFRILHPGLAHTDHDIMIEVVEEKVFFSVTSCVTDCWVRSRRATRATSLPSIVGSRLARRCSCRDTVAAATGQWQ